MTVNFNQPTNDIAILEDEDLDDFFQSFIVGLSGLDGSLVRPRWQASPPNLPENTVDWCAVGVQDIPSDEYAFVGHNSATERDVMQRHEELLILCSFYGPKAKGYAALVRDNLSIEENRWPLAENGMGLISCDKGTPVPELVNTVWYYRVDMPIRIKRAVTRAYQVNNITSASGTVTADDGIAEISKSIIVTNS